MVATLIKQAPTQKAAPVKPGLVLELVGPASAGKTTLTRALVTCSAKVTVGPDISVRRPRHLAVFVRNAPLALPVLLPRRQDERRFTWDEVKSVVYLKGWPRVLRREAAANRGAILLDQGPVFRLATLHGFGPAALRRPAAETWWNETFKQWASLLDLVVWLDAPGSVLEERINARERWHLVKGKTEQETTQFLDRYRSSYRYVLAKLSAEGGPRIIPFDTSQVPVEQLVNIILAACDLEPRYD